MYIIGIDTLLPRHPKVFWEGPVDVAAADAETLRALCLEEGEADMYLTSWHEMVAEMGLEEFAEERERGYIEEHVGTRRFYICASRPFAWLLCRPLRARPSSPPPMSMIVLRSEDEFRRAAAEQERLGGAGAAGFASGVPLRLLGIMGANTMDVVLGRVLCGPPSPAGGSPEPGAVASESQAEGAQSLPAIE